MLVLEVRSYQHIWDSSLIRRALPRCGHGDPGKAAATDLQKETSIIPVSQMGICELKEDKGGFPRSPKSGS